MSCDLVNHHALVQDFGNSSSSTMMLLQSCTKPSKCTSLIHRLSSGPKLMHWRCISVFSLPFLIYDTHTNMCVVVSLGFCSLILFIHGPNHHSASIRRLGVPVPCRSRHFRFPKLRHFHKNIHACVENESCCPRTVNISNVDFTTKIPILPELIFKYMGQQMFGPDSSSGYSIRHKSEG